MNGATIQAHDSKDQRMFAITSLVPLYPPPQPGIPQTFLSSLILKPPSSTTSPNAGRSHTRTSSAAISAAISNPHTNGPWCSQTAPTGGDAPSQCPATWAALQRFAASPLFLWLHFSGINARCQGLAKRGTEVDAWLKVQSPCAQWTVGSASTTPYFARCSMLQKVCSML